MPNGPWMGNDSGQLELSIPAESRILAYLKLVPCPLCHECPVLDRSFSPFKRKYLYRVICPHSTETYQNVGKRLCPQTPIPLEGTEFSGDAIRAWQVYLKIMESL